MYWTEEHDKLMCREILAADSFEVAVAVLLNIPWGGGALQYMGYIGMCRCEGYGFQAVYSRIGYINQSVWV